MFGLADWLVDHYRRGWLAVMQEIWRKRREGWLAALLLFGGLAVLEGVVLAVLVREALAGQVSVGQVVTLVSAIAAAGVLGVFHDGHQQLAEARLTLKRGGTAGTQRPRRPAAWPGASAAPTACPRQAIRLEGVGFTYPGRTEPVFRQARPDHRGRALAGHRGGQRRRQDHAGEAAGAAVRPQRRAASPSTGSTCGRSTRPSGTGGWRPSSRTSCSSS